MAIIGFHESNSIAHLTIKHDVQANFLFPLKANFRAIDECWLFPRTRARRQIALFQNTRKDNRFLLLNIRPCNASFYLAISHCIIRRFVEGNPGGHKTITSFNHQHIANSHQFHGIMNENPFLVLRTHAVVWVRSEVKWIKKRKKKRETSGHKKKLGRRLLNKTGEKKMIARLSCLLAYTIVAPLNMKFIKLNAYTYTRAFLLFTLESSFEKIFSVET